MENEIAAHFGLADYAVFIVMLAISASIGVYYRFTGGKQQTMEEYMLANKSMSVIPVAFSLVASFMSAITLLGVSAENYIYGTQFVLINLAYAIATPFITLGYLPVFFKLQATSAYEYLERRFGYTSRLVASMAFSLQMILYMGIVLYAPAIALAAVTGLSKIVSILSVGLVCTFYCTIGGMKAVLITDVFQSILMFAAVLCVIIQGASENGGFAGIWEAASEGERLEFFNFDTDPRVRQTFWTQVIGGIFTYLSIYGVNQAQVQRLLTVKNLKKSQTALWLCLPILGVLVFATSWAGLTIYAHYQKCDPIKEKKISSPDQLLPLFVVETLGSMPGLSGLFVAGIFSGSLSTVSSAVNSLAAVTVEDFIKPGMLYFQNVHMDDKSTSRISKCMVLFFGLVCLGLAFLAEYLGGVLQASLTIFGVVGGPILGLFTLGMFFSFTNEVGSLMGFFISLVFSLWLGFGGPKPRPPTLPVRIDGCDIINSTMSSMMIPEMSLNTSASSEHSSTESNEYFVLYTISYMWYSVLGFLITVVCGIALSCLRNCCSRSSTEEEIDPDLLSPLVASYTKQKEKEVTLKTLVQVDSGNALSCTSTVNI